MILVSLLISASVFADSREIKDVRFSEVISESALTEDRIVLIKSNIESYVADCDKTEQIFEASDIQHEVLPLNYKGSDVTEPQHVLKISVYGACLDK